MLGIGAAHCHQLNLQIALKERLSIASTPDEAGTIKKPSAEGA